VSWYQKKHSPTHTYPDHQPSLISFLHLLHPRSIYMLDSLFAQPPSKSSLVYLGLEPFTPHSIHFFTQSLSSFCNTCPYYQNMFCCSNEIMSSIPSLSLNSLLVTLSFTLTSHIHLTTRLYPLKCHLIFFPYRKNSHCVTSMQHTYYFSHN